MDNDLFETGLAQRKATLGAEYVESNLAAADDFTRPFQEAMTAWCWGFGWGDDCIDPRTRSMMNLAMIGALGDAIPWKDSRSRGKEKSPNRNFATIDSPLQNWSLHPLKTAS